ncbi:hypothetical protein SeMB42_g07075 [Synchytrium endobioticum]|uniref:VPS9 domain-containing protein n=1 Tax=Synchytrium endobioticum TaxID=286115 RepID=A0A507CBA3_9FUNG|nr:hypothetical protein SeMB42_g07075 [Synchytrium endobioticum]
MQRCLSESPVYSNFRTSDVHGVSRMINGLIIYVLTRCHDVTFDSVVANSGGMLEDEEYSRQVSLLNVTGFDLTELGLQVNNMDELRNVIRSAGIELSRFERGKCPQQKLAAIVKCHRCIAESIPLLQVVQVDDATSLSPAIEQMGNADSILPILIYILFKVDPPRLKSNQRYTSQFCPPSVLVGDVSYSWTNLCAAISYLESVDLSQSLPADILPLKETVSHVKLCQSTTAPSPPIPTNRNISNGAVSSPTFGANTVHVASMVTTGVVNGVSGIVNAGVGITSGVMDVGSSMASNLWPFSKRLPGPRSFSNQSAAKEAQMTERYFFERK